MLARIIYSLFLIVASCPAIAVTVNDIEKLELAPYVTYFKENQVMSFEQVKQLDDSNWHPLPRNYINFGYTHDTFWFKFKINIEDQSDLIYLTSEYPCTDLIEVFVERQNNGQVSYEHFQAGDRIPYYDRPYDHPFPIFPISLTESSELTFYIRLKTLGSSQLPLYLVSEDKIKSGIYSMWFINAYFSAAGGVFIFLCLVFYAFREKAFLKHIYFTLAIMLFISTYYGITFQLWPNSTDFQHDMLASSTVLALLCGVIFAEEIFDIKQASLGVQRWFTITKALGVFLVLWSFFVPYFISLIVNLMYVGYVCALSFIFYAHPDFKWNRYGKTFAVGVFIFSLSCAMQVANEISLPFFGDDSIGLYFILIGVTSQVFVLTLVPMQRLLLQRKELENLKLHLLSSEKMTSLGRLASGIIHEIKNPLTPIESIFRVLPNIDDAALRNEIIEDGRHEVNRIKEIINGLYSFAYPGEHEKSEQLKLKEVIDEAHKLVKGRLSGAYYTCSVEEGIEVFGNRSSLIQVFLSIISNSAFAIQQKTFDQGSGEIKISVTPSGLKKGCVHLSICDNGIGMDKEQIKNIFDPFYKATNADAEAYRLGLGLSIVHQIIEQHGGLISIDSKKGKWTRVDIHLPVKSNHA